MSARAELAYTTGQARSAVLVAAVGLLGFLAYIAAIHALGWISFPIVPVASTFAGLAVLNVGLATRTAWWARSRWSAWLYEGFHAVVLTVVLYEFGGMSVGVYLMVYGFLVIHTEVLCPSASVFVTANWCAVCYGVLGLLEQVGWILPPAVIAPALTSGQRLVFVTFGALSFNFLAVYAERHGRQLRELAHRLDAMVIERTAELRHAKDNLEQRSAALEHSYQALEEKGVEFRTFIYSVTHDLKNPLNSVLLTANLVLRRDAGRLTAETREDLEQIARTAAHGENMLRDLLELFRVTSDREAPQAVDMRRLVGQTLDTLRPRITCRGVKVTVGSLPEVWGQSKKLTHVLSNLLDNAVKYAPPGRGEVSVTGHRENGHAIISVRDNGAGIPEVYHRRVFDLFGRVPTEDQPDGAEADGTGVGLALVKRIVEEHRGRVWLESAPGAGTCVHVSLPASDASKGQDPDEGDGW